jgi:hypothetical protein
MPDGVSPILCVCLTIIIAVVLVGRSRTGFQASRFYVLDKQRYQEGQHAEAERLFRTAVEKLSDLTTLTWAWSLTAWE